MLSLAPVSIPLSNTSPISALVWQKPALEVCTFHSYFSTWEYVTSKLALQILVQVFSFFICSIITVIESHHVWVACLSVKRRPCYQPSHVYGDTCVTWHVVSLRCHYMYIAILIFWRWQFTEQIILDLLWYHFWSVRLIVKTVKQEVLNRQDGLDLNVWSDSS